ncbi:hypothetical protein JCM16814_12810 [Desulfobaculum senezii]
MLFDLRWFKDFILKNPVYTHRCSVEKAGSIVAWGWSVGWERGRIIFWGGEWRGGAMGGARRGEGGQRAQGRRQGRGANEAINTPFPHVGIFKGKALKPAEHTSRTRRYDPALPEATVWRCGGRVGLVLVVAP